MLLQFRKSLELLPPPLRRRWLVLIPLSVSAAAVEALGAAAVFAFIKVISDPQQVFELPLLSAAYRVFPWRDDQAIVVSFAALVAAFYIVKNVYLASLEYVLAKLTGLSRACVATRLFAAYLGAPYALHLRRNSSDLIQTANHSAEMIFSHSMAPAIACVSEILVVLGIVSVLLTVAPWLTLTAVGTLALLALVLLAGMQRWFREFGAREQSVRARILQTLRQSLEGLKDVKVMAREGYFGRLFAEQQAVLTRLSYLRAFLLGAPRFLIETLFVCATLLIIVLLSLTEDLGPEIVPLLGLFAYAGFRVIPSTNRIIMHLNTMAYGSTAIDRVSCDLEMFARPVSQADDGVGGDELTFRDSIALENVSFSYEGSASPALADVSLTIRRGESIGIVGATGAGKTTLVDVVLGLLQPSAGRMTVDGVEIGYHVGAWQRRIGYVPQSVFLTDDSLRRNVAFGLNDDEIDEMRVRAAIRMAQLDRFIESLPSGLNTVVGERGVRLSGGARQRVALARALYRNPDILVFDEATSALDQETERELTGAVEGLHGVKTVVVIAHRLSTIRTCGRLVFLRNGRVAGTGTFDEVAQQSPEFRRMAAVDHHQR